MRLSRYITLVVLAGVLALILSACGARTRPDEETAIARAPTVALPTATPQRIATSTVAPTATPRPTASRTPTATPTQHSDRVADCDCDGHAAESALDRVYARAGVSRKRNRDRTEAPGRGELPALSRFVPLRGTEAVRAADGAQRDAACDRLAGDHLQPRLYPAGAIPDDRALRRVRGWIRSQRLHRLSARLPRPRSIGRECVRGVWLARLHHRRAERHRVAQALSRRRPQPDRDVGPLDGRPHHAAFHGHDPGHQSGRDLGRGGGVLSRSDEPVAAAGAGLGADHARRWRDDFVQQYGSPESNPAFWASISPSSYLADLSGPLQLHHGTADESVPTEFSQTLYQQAQEAKLSVPVDYYEYPGDNHNLSKSFNTAMQRSIAFFDKYVKNAAQPAAAATN